MKKLFITLTVVLLLIPTITLAQEKFSPFVEAPQAKSAEPQNTRASIILYLWGGVFNYQASNDQWWSGLVISAAYPVEIKVVLKDSNGNVTGQGIWQLAGSNQQRIAVLKDMIGGGYVPEQGSVFVYGNNTFSATLIVGNTDGGFGMIEKDAVSLLQ